MKILILIAAWTLWCVCLKGAEPIVAAVICAEARGEGHVGMAAVWEVIWTRSKLANRSPSWVVTRPQHFSSLNGMTPTKLIQDMSRTPQWEEALEIASRPPKGSLTHGATHFDRSDRRPDWAAGLKPVAIIGHHSFYCLK